MLDTTAKLELTAMQLMRLPHTTHRSLLVFLLAVLVAAPLPCNSLPASLTPDFIRQPGARIGIVGAGPAGLHMAYLLQRLGFKNVLMLEASDRIGGRAHTKHDTRDPEGVVHELGTCYLNSDYTDLRNMARAINYRLDEVILPEAVLRNGSATTGLRQFVIDRVRRLDSSLGPNPSLEAVEKQIYKAKEHYLALRSEIFPAGEPTYLEFPLTQPRPEALAKVNCTIEDFLKANKLMALEPFFLLGMTSMGYGSVQDTSALYGLMWITPAYLNDLTGPRNSSNLTMLRDGFERLWEATKKKLIHLGGVEFRLNSKVAQVIRASSGQPRVLLKLVNGSDIGLDWLVWTPSVLKAADVFVNLTHAEQAAFAGLSMRKFRTCLVRFPGPQVPHLAADPVAYYLDAIESTGDIKRLLAVRNSAGVLLGPRAAINGSATIVAYYLSGYAEGSARAVSSSECDDNLMRESAGEILATKTFDYMPRYSVTDMAAGALWRVLRDVQGVRSTWFAGHSVVFDSVKSVLKYNKMLLHRVLAASNRTLLETL